jgi:hypothetical protein
MTSRMQILSIPCRGGLNLSSNNHELLSKPGEAIDLVNFECSKEGGYRRISGYTPLTTSVPNTGYIKGVLNYKGVLSARGDGVYHTTDNVTWTQVNRDMDNVVLASVAAATVLPRTDSIRYMFSKYYYDNKEYVYMVDGKNQPAVFSLTDTGEYRYAEITADPTDGSTPLNGAKYCTFYKNQLILAGMTSSPTSIVYSSLANTDLISPEDDDKETPQENFNGTTSGVLDFGDIVTGIMTHRETLYVFCRSGIYKVNGLETGQLQSVPLTRDIGCVDGFTVQEIGGDLLFLAPDGLRTVAKTERLDDIELGVVSRKVTSVITPRVSQPERYLFFSTVIREKNQYRLWFTDLANPTTAQRGIIAAYTYLEDKQSFEWCFSEMLGLGVTAVNNSYSSGAERIIHGNQDDGQIMVQEGGDTFNGVTIPYIFQSVFTDYGDIGSRKTIHKALVNSRAEGNVEAGLEVRYDYNGKDVFQPAIYPLDRMTLPAIFGKPRSTFGDSIVLFGATTYGDTDVYTEGSGFVVSLRIKSLQTIQDSPFDIQSFEIDLTKGGKI